MRKAECQRYDTPNIQCQHSQATPVQVQLDCPSEASVSIALVAQPALAIVVLTALRDCRAPTPNGQQLDLRSATVL